MSLGQNGMYLPRAGFGTTAGRAPCGEGEGPGAVEGDFAPGKRNNRIRGASECQFAPGKEEIRRSSRRGFRRPT